MSTLSSLSDTKNTVQPNNLTNNKKDSEDAEHILYNLSQSNNFSSKKPSPNDSSWNKKVFLVLYYDLNDKNETDTNKGLSQPKDKDIDKFNLEDLVKALTATIEDKKSDEHKQHFQVTQNAFKSKDSNHDSPFTNADTKIHEQMVFGEKTKQA